MKTVVCGAQLRLVFKNIKLLFLIFMTVLVSFTWLFYSQKDEYKHNREKTQCVEWALDLGDPQKAVGDAVNDLVMNAGTVNLRFTDSFYDEYMLYTEAGEHLKKTLGYRNEIENVIAAKKGQLGFADPVAHPAHRGAQVAAALQIPFIAVIAQHRLPPQIAEGDHRGPPGTEGNREGFVRNREQTRLPKSFFLDHV